MISSSKTKPGIVVEVQMVLTLINPRVRIHELTVMVVMSQLLLL